jgi:cysteine synthase A
MLPDTGERYLGAYLFEDVPEGSDDEWLESLEG